MPFLAYFHHEDPPHPPFAAEAMAPTAARSMAERFANFDAQFRSFSADHPRDKTQNITRSHSHRHLDHDQQYDVVIISFSVCFNYR
jgi:hypothetical protein